MHVLRESPRELQCVLAPKQPSADYTVRHINCHATPTARHAPCRHRAFPGTAWSHAKGRMFAKPCSCNNQERSSDVTGPYTGTNLFDATTFHSPPAFALGTWNSYIETSPQCATKTCVRHFATPHAHMFNERRTPSDRPRPKTDVTPKTVETPRVFCAL